MNNELLTMMDVEIEQMGFINMLKGLRARGLWAAKQRAFQN